MRLVCEGVDDMIHSNAFDYINVLDKAADASWLRNEVLSNNIANADTPGYKRQDVDFESQLSKALGKSTSKSTDAKVAALKSKDLTATTYSDYDGFNYRLDENNVDIQVENVNLAKNQLKYNGLMTSVRMEFQNLQTVMK